MKWNHRKPELVELGKIFQLSPTPVLSLPVSLSLLLFPALSPPLWLPLLIVKWDVQFGSPLFPLPQTPYTPVNVTDRDVSSRAALWLPSAFGF